MNQFSILSLSAVLALGVASISDSTFAQQRVTKDQLVGTWTLVSVSCPNPNRTPQCVDPNGLLMYDANGRYMVITAPRGRPKFTSTGDRTAHSPEEYKAVVEGFVSNFGTWSFNEADQTVTRHEEVTFSPNFEGRDLKASITLVGDELRTGNAVWRRVK